MTNPRQRRLRRLRRSDRKAIHEAAIEKGHEEIRELKRLAEQEDRKAQRTLAPETSMKAGKPITGFGAFAGIKTS